MPGEAVKITNAKEFLILMSSANHSEPKRGANPHNVLNSCLLLEKHFLAFHYIILSRLSDKDSEGRNLEMRQNKGKLLKNPLSW